MTIFAFVISLATIGALIYVWVWLRQQDEEIKKLYNRLADIELEQATHRKTLEQQAEFKWPPRAD